MEQSAIRGGSLESCGNLLEVTGLRDYFSALAESVDAGLGDGEVVFNA